MKILLLDIETAPNIAYVWNLWKETINIDRILNSGYVLSWAARWYGDGPIKFDSIHQSSPKRMLQRIHSLLDETDVVVHYNGSAFDIPTLNKEFVTHGLLPPSPYKQIDLLRAVREAFRFPSNKLDYVATTLGLGQKVRHPGFELWVKCMAGDEKAWAMMERYNKHDVVLLERLYERLKPWVKGHPNHGAHDDTAVCPNCGGNDYHRRGYAIARNFKYPRYQCRKCATWFRGVKTVTSRRVERFTAAS